MSEDEKLVRDVLAAADGRIIGRIRIQKIFYLLEQLGLSSRFRFSYHYFGPYSGELALAIERAKILDKSVKEDLVPFDGEGGFYSVYELAAEQQIPEQVGEIPSERARELISRMKRETSVVIELAATIHWLRKKEKIADWCHELKLRKPTKAQDPQIQRARALLEEIGLTE